MARSYEKINYSLRPAKSIERKMLCEAFRRLSEFRLVESYRYIGFGSLYFSDFILLHRELNISVMKSIESDREKEARFRFNMPFNCIDIVFGESGEVLPTIDWDVICTIVWLDYDGELNSNVLSDIKHICTKACPGSVLTVSVNAQPLQYDEDKPNARLDKLRVSVGPDKVPLDVDDKKLRAWGLAKECRRIINNEIIETLNDRNGARPSGSKIKYEQLFNFHYADGAKMLTVGGVFYDEGQSAKLQSCGFSSLEFYRNDEDPYLIEVPNLTLNEIRYINSKLPSEDLSVLLSLGISRKDIEQYAQIYRYYPTYAEACF